MSRDLVRYIVSGETVRTAYTQTDTEFWNLSITVKKFVWPGYEDVLVPGEDLMQASLTYDPENGLQLKVVDA